MNPHQNQGKRVDKISPNNMQNQAMKNMKNNSVNGSINGIGNNGNKTFLFLLLSENIFLYLY